MQLFSRRPIFRLITAVLLAGSCTRFTAHYAILDFSGAPVCVFIFTAAAYLLLSRCYEDVLHAVFLAGSLFIAYKAMSLQHPPETATDQRDIILNRLTMAVAATLLQRLDSGDVPGAQESARGFPGYIADKAWDYCATPCDDTFNPPTSSAKFWWRFNANSSRDKEATLWYINDSFEVWQYHRERNFHEQISL